MTLHLISEWKHDFIEKTCFGIEYILNSRQKCFIKKEKFAFWIQIFVLRFSLNVYLVSAQEKKSRWEKLKVCVSIFELAREWQMNMCGIVSGEACILLLSQR